MSLFKVRCIRYLNRDGRRCSKVEALAPGPDGNPKLRSGYRRVANKSRKWYGQYRGPDGKVRRVPLAADKTAAGQMFAALVRKAELRQANCADPFEEHHRRPLIEHVDEYRRFLEAEGNISEYVVQTCSRIRAVNDRCRFAFITDLAAEKVSEFLHQLRRDPPWPALPPGQESFTPQELIRALNGVRPPRLARLLRREGLAYSGAGNARRYPRATVEALQERVLRGIGIGTSNGYLDALKGFSRWLATKDRTDRDRLASLSRLNASTDVRHERRALEDEELRALLSAAAASGVEVQGMTGWDRCVLYLVAMTTGFRASELASLFPASFDLGADSPTVTVKAAFSKNRRTSVQPLPPDVAAGLNDYLASLPADRAVWPGDWHKDAAEMLRVDLTAAGIPYRDEQGRVLDFHALRGCYVTMLQRSGVHPKLAQELARHSDIRLTMQVYTHLRLHDLAVAVESLPRLLPSPSEARALAATGTEGAGISYLARPGCTMVAHANEVSCDSPRRPERQDGSHRSDASNRNILDLQEDASGSDSVRTDEKKLPGQDSNLDKENQNLLCAVH